MDLGHVECNSNTTENILNVIYYKSANKQYVCSVVEKAMQVYDQYKNDEDEGCRKYVQ